MSSEAGPSKEVGSKTNRLGLEKSPYLLQHATNPVDWYPWSQEAFDKAEKENKMIFLSVGYSTCHWLVSSWNQLIQHTRKQSQYEE